MHDLNSKNVTEDPIKIPGQLNEVVPLTPVQIFVKEEQFIRDQLPEVVPLSPVQIFLKDDDGVCCKAEEPVLVSLVPVLPKEEHEVDELPEDFEEGSGPLIINLENSPSEDWSNHSDPLAVEQNEANVSYVEYVEASEPILMDLEAASAEISSHPLRITQEATSTAENGELYDLMGSGEVVQLPENDTVSPDRNTDGECVEITDVLCIPPKAFRCAFCRERFATEGEMQIHTLSHAGRAAARSEVPEAKLRPKHIRTLRAQHTCGECSESFDRLEHLMRHRLGHIRAALRKPFSMPKLFSPPKPLGTPKQSGMPQPQLEPQPQVAATPNSRRTVAAVSMRTSPKRAPHRAVTSQTKRWPRRKKTRRRWVS